MACTGRITGNGRGIVIYLSTDLDRLFGFSDRFTMGCNKVVACLFQQTIYILTKDVSKETKKQTNERLLLLSCMIISQKEGNLPLSGYLILLTAFPSKFTTLTSHSLLEFILRFLSKVPLAKDIRRS